MCEDPELIISAICCMIMYLRLNFRRRAKKAKIDAVKFIINDLYFSLE